MITFYSAQSNRLYRRLHNRPDNIAFANINLRVGTVDRFQGMERPIVIASLVRNNKNHNIGFAKEPERINVAFSRAQELLVIIGCATLFTQEARGYGGITSQYYKSVYDITLREEMVIPADKFLSQI